MLIFNLINRDYIYNLSWEDFNIDRKLLDIDKNDNIAMITTGGDNILNTLILDPNKIFSIDFNPHQNYLLELKIAAIKSLERKDTLTLFRSGENGEQHYYKIRPFLSRNAQVFWDNKTHRLNNLLRSGHCGWIVFFIGFIMQICGITKEIKKIKNYNSQQKYYYKNIKYFAFISNILYFFEKFLAPYVGVPREQLKRYDTTNFWQSLFEHLWLHTNLIENNYFYHGYLFDGFWKCYPEWLQEDNYLTVRKRLNRITILNGSLKDCLIKFPDNFFTKINLLDHMDWMDDFHVKEEFDVFKDKLSSDAKIMFRSFDTKIPHKCLTLLNYESSNIIPRCENKDADRVGMYNSVHICNIPEKMIFGGSKPKKISQNLIRVNNLKLLYYNLVDYYRSKILQGKNELMNRLTYEKEQSILIISNKADNILEYMPVNQLGKIDLTYISNCSLNEAMLKKDSAKYNIVSLSELDKEKYDQIIINYSLTMIPNWKNTLEDIFNSLKPSGYLAITDFISDSDSLCTWLFAFYKIYLNREHIKTLITYFGEPIWLEEKLGGFSFFPTFLKYSYYYGLFQKKTLKND